MEVCILWAAHNNKCSWVVNSMHKHCNGSESPLLGRNKPCTFNYRWPVWSGDQVELPGVDGVPNWTPTKTKIEANVNQASSEVVENDLATDLQWNERWVGWVGYRTCPNETTQCGTNQQSGGRPTLGRGHQCSGTMSTGATYSYFWDTS